MESPAISCPLLPPFEAADLRAVRQAFAAAPACALRQSWRAELERDFAPGMVWTGWREETLLVLAELEDADIFTGATRANERLWELGDTLEIFLRPAHQAAYSELQVAPNNQRLQLRYASADALAHARKTNSLTGALAPDIAFHSRTWLRPEGRGWHALLEIPMASVCDRDMPRRGSSWHFSYCRYDYTRGRPDPVISSTSALLKPDFHRQAEWGTMRLV